MCLVDLNSMLRDADRNGYAVGAYNFCNAETAQAIIETGTRLRSPIMLIIGEWEVDLLGPKMVVNIIRSLAQDTDMPVCLHLDHAVNPDAIKTCIEAGFPSVMIDGSFCDTFEENVRITKTVVDMAKDRGITVEAELGAVGRVDGDSPESNGKMLLTDPSQAAEFVARTGIDALAVSIGNGHGMYPQSPELDFERLQAIRNVTGIPLVLHGGSGTPADQLHKAIEIGISKVNVASELAQAYLRTIDNRESGVWYTKVIMQAKSAVAEVVDRWMHTLGSAGRIG